MTIDFTKPLTDAEALAVTAALRKFPHAIHPGARVPDGEDPFNFGQTVRVIGSLANLLTQREEIRALARQNEFELDRLMAHSHAVGVHAYLEQHIPAKKTEQLENLEGGIMVLGDIDELDAAEAGRVTPATES